MFGDQLDWGSPLVDVMLMVELPFWLMLDDCDLDVPVGGALSRVSLRDSYAELYAGEVRGSLASLVWQGPAGEQPVLSEEAAAAVEELGAAWRLLRTVVKFAGRAHGDVFAALGAEEGALPRRGWRRRRTWRRCVRRTFRC